MREKFQGGCEVNLTLLRQVQTEGAAKQSLEVPALWRSSALRMTAVILLIVAFPALWGGDNSQAQKFLRPGALPPGWQIPLLTMGDRMLKPGKERLVVAGTVTRNGSATTQFQATHELPNSIRYQEQGGPAAGTVVFDGNQFGKSAGSAQKLDSDLVETLAFDSPVWFLYAPAKGLPVRKLGSRFRTDGQKGSAYSGSVHDVYLLLVPVQQPGKVKQQPKFFHVNSDTQLIERVSYQDADSPGTKVEIVLGNWATVSNNKVPQLIRRLENGVEVLRFNITSAVFGPSLADGAFQKP